MPQPDILLFMSDQHTPYCVSGGAFPVDTPNIEKLRRDGVSFDNAYTPCPLCVPARMAFMSTLMPYRTGIYGNLDTLADTAPTFVHSLTAAGYETVLCGRMHFVGRDQRHGFTKRVAPDTTPVSWARPVDKLRRERGIMGMTFADMGAVRVVGGGQSPVMHYDDMVIQAALDYLSQPHDKPQFILVGTYGPHFPYVCTPELFQKYYERVSPSPTLRDDPPWLCPPLQKRRREVTDDVARGCVAAYCGLVERMDGQIGRVRAAFDNFCKTRGTDGVFGYLSDHGDQLGDRRMFGKDTFFEKSVKIPLMFAGAGIQKGVAHEGGAVSLLDVGPTVLSLCGAEPMPLTDGADLSACLAGAPPDEERVVLAEQMEGWMALEGEDYHYARMAAQGDLKFFTYPGYEGCDALFDVRKDPLERENIITKHPEKAAFLRKAAAITGDPAEIVARQRRRAKAAQWFISYERATGLDDSQRWQGNPPEARGHLEVAVTKQPPDMPPLMAMPGKPQ